MILQALTSYYETLAEQGKAARTGWCQAKVSCALDISEGGELFGIVSLKEEVQKGKKMVWVPRLMEVPERVTRASGIAANFLCDNSKYLLGIDRNGTDRRILDCFEAAKKKHLDILEQVSGETAEAIRQFFHTWDPKRAKEHPEVAEKWEDLTSDGNLVFYVNGVFAQENEEIRAAWEQAESGQEQEVKGTCLVTGEHTAIARIHSPIRGIAGAQSAGAALVSFNAPAFESYGKEQSYNAPVGNYAAFAYTTALNYLVAQRDYVFRLGDTTVVFWAESGEELYQQLFMESMEPTEDNQEKLKGIFANLQAGKPLDVEGISFRPEQKFYVLGLTPNAARLSVRFFYQNSIGEILQNVQKHYQEMELVRPAWDKREFLGVWRLLMETANPKARDKKPPANMAGAVFEAILSGRKYPESLYSNVLIRVRAEQGGVNRGRAAIVKAHLIRNVKSQWMKEGTFVGLNEECRSTAYLLGREFAVLEAIQEEASGNVNATIKDRYFNSACAAPASVFPILLKLKNSHMRKLAREKAGRKIYFENMLTNLQGKIEVEDDAESAYPRRLSLEEQGMFILGYYHQTQKRYEKKEEKENE